MRGTPVLVSPETGTTVADPPYLHSIPDVARLLGGITERQVYRLIADGQFKSVKLGRRRLVRDTDLRAYVDSLTADGDADAAGGAA